MKELKRNERGIDFVKFLAEDSRQRGLSAYSEDAIRAFGNLICANLTASVASEHRVRGLRAEALFLAVITGIGKVQLIKEEDAGEVFFSGPDLLVPDFRILPADGPQILVEVKAHRSGSLRPPYKLGHSSVVRLKQYSDLMGGELRIAIFWENLRTWTLNRLEAFRAGEAGTKQWSISFPRALATSEMATLGDRTVGVLAPLRFRVVLDQEKSEVVREGETGEFRLVIQEVQIISEDRVLSGLAARIAWNLAWYGKWTEERQESHYENGRLASIDHLIVPPEWDETAPQGPMPEMIGALSEIISNAYLSGAQATVHTTAKGEVLEPSYVGTLIPADFASLNLDLRLWLFELRPNFDFAENEEAGGA